MTIEMANRLCSYRKAHRLSQEELAARIGVSRQAVSKWERAESAPDTDNLILLAQLYGVTLDALLYTDPAPDTESAADTESTLDTAEAEAAPQEPPRDESRSQRIRAAYAAPVPVCCLIAYLIFGFTGFGGGWAFGWLVFLAVPLYYTLIAAVDDRNPMAFAFPVLVVWIYLWLGFRFGLWHPMWILFLTVPVYYGICAAIERD